MKCKVPSLAVAVVLSLALNAAAQEAKDMPLAEPATGRIADLEKRLEALEGRFKEVIGKVETLGGEVSSLAARQKDDAIEIYKQILQTQRLVQDNQSDIAQLRKDIAHLTSVVQSDSQILKTELGRLQKSGSYTPNLLGNMQREPEFRREMQQSVQGKFVIENNLGMPSYLYINGALWRIPASRYSYIWAPIGRVQVATYPQAQQSVHQNWVWRNNAQGGSWVLYYSLGGNSESVRPSAYPSAELE